jgi:hypothetical protein
MVTAPAGLSILRISNDSRDAPMNPLKLDGDFYPNFIKDKGYSNEALQAIQETVRKLLEQPTSVNKPGMLLGKVQSGKTKTFMGIMALGFDNGFEVCVVLTKGTKALTKQTFERLEKEFSSLTTDDLVQVFEGTIARAVATQVPMLMLFRQNGAEAQGWMGAPFYWPVLYPPKNTKTAIFASDVVDED